MLRLYRPAKMTVLDVAGPLGVFYGAAGDQHGAPVNAHPREPEEAIPKGDIPLVRSDRRGARIRSDHDASSGDPTLLEANSGAHKVTAVQEC